MKKQLLTDCYSSPLGNSRPSFLGKGLILSSLVMGMFWGSQVVQASTIFTKTGPYTGDPIATTTFPDSDALDLTVTDFTMSACILQTRNNGTSASAILTKRNANYGWALVLNGNNGGNIRTNAVKVVTAANSIVGSNQSLSLNTTYHVAVVYKAGVVQIFINGINDGTKAVIPPKASTSVLRVGGDFDFDSDGIPNGRWHGTLSNLQIDNTALSQAQIQTLSASCVVTPDLDPDHCDYSKDGTRRTPITPGPTYNLATGELHIPQLSIIGSTQICEMYLQQQPLLSDFSLDASRLICK